MKIPEEIIEKVIQDKTLSTYQSINFKEGVRFAEEYLKDLAIEFAEFSLEYEKTPHLNRMENTQELFEIFIKEKYE